MTKLMALLLAGAAVLTAAGAGFAQDVPVAAEKPAPVIIAPVKSDLGRAVKAMLAEAYYNAPKSEAARIEGQRLYFFYGGRGFEPIWLEKDASGKSGFSLQARNILHIFKNAGSEGLRPSDYLTPDIDIEASGNEPEKLAKLETAFSASALRYAQHVYAGRIDPRQISSAIDVTPPHIEDADILTKLAASADPAPVLAELEPKHPEFLRLKAALAKFEDDAANSPLAAIAEGQTLRPGMADPRMPLIRERLGLAAVPNTDDGVYDEAAIAALKAFQEKAGLEADGIIGPETLAALNGPQDASKQDILANMERWRWMPRELGAFNVFVNIPEFRLAVNKDGQETYTTRVVVGTPKNQTVIFSDTIRHIVVNPYWNVPPSIARNEIAPKMRANPGYIAAQNMELVYNGRIVSPYQVNWANVGGRFPFRVRQKPGAGNALGAVKFLFPNVHDIYLHDTPSKALFERAFRAFSHGCVRVQNPMDFADALLAGEPEIDAAGLEAMYGTKERWVNLKNQVPVHLAYFTLRVGEDGIIHTFGDVYGHNKKLIELMAL